MVLSSNLCKNAMYSINFSIKPISSLFSLSDFPQRTVERGLPIGFMIKIKASKSMSLYMHTHTHMYIHAYIYIYTHMYVNPRQKSHGSRNSENKTHCTYASLLAQ